MSKEIKAQHIIDRIRTQLSKTWKDLPADVFNTGKPDTLFTGITTSFTPSIEVLKKSVATGKNLIITQQPLSLGDGGIS